ncbi:Chitinase A, N-terminal domain [Paenibacillaceae bacterium GAS479]|nr:Chitinase A, N-terminal domain [Paenibacillaceae bacterium GAS479]
MLAYRFNAVAGRQAGVFTAGSFHVSRNEATKKTVYEMSIPWNELLPAGVTAQEGSELGISFLANYSDGSRPDSGNGDVRNGWIEYNSGIGSIKAPDQFGYLLLKNAPFAVPTLNGSVKDGKAALNWSASSDATGYSVLYGTESGVYPSVLNAGSATEYETTALEFGTYYFVVKAHNAYGETVKSQEVALTVKKDSPPLYKGVPGKPILSSNIAQANGLKDGNYTVTMNMWWGNNGDTLKVYENGVLISTQALVDASPAAQTAKVEVKGKANGTYKYTAELINSFGTTKSNSLIVKVTDAAPGKPILLHDNWDGDGSFKLTMNMWWGTNGTEYRLYENGVLIETKALTANSPNAQQAVKSITGRAKGAYEYRVELVNSAGVTSSNVLKVNVRK